MINFDHSILCCPNTNENLSLIEDKYPKTLGIIGDYPIIVIKK